MSCFTVGTYSEGNLLVVYEIKRQVFPTAPSPTTTHFIVCMLKLKNVLLIGSNFKRVKIHKLVSSIVRLGASLYFLAFLTSPITNLDTKLSNLL